MALRTSLHLHRQTLNTLAALLNGIDEELSAWLMLTSPRQTVLVLQLDKYT